MNDAFINTHKDLRKLYGEALGIAVDKQQSELDKYSEQFLTLSPFSILSTSDKNCIHDCSPRGDYPGFIQKIDNRTIAIPDRPGNNRLDSLSNIIDNPNVGLLVLVPGFGECLRINGSAKITIDEKVLSGFKYKNSLPKSVVIISISEIYFHCTKAIKRSNLWAEKYNTDRSVMPSFGRILMAQIDPNKSEKEITDIETLIEDRAKNTLY